MHGVLLSGILIGVIGNQAIVGYGFQLQVGLGWKPLEFEEEIAGAGAGYITDRNSGIGNGWLGVGEDDFEGISKGEGAWAGIMAGIETNDWYCILDVEVFPQVHKPSLLTFKAHSLSPDSPCSQLQQRFPYTEA